MRRYASGFHTLAVISLATAGVLTGCSPVSLSRAPVESRESQRSTAPVQHRSDTRPVIVDSHGNVINSGQRSGAAQSHPVPSRSDTGTTAHQSPFPAGSTVAVTTPSTGGAAADYRSMAGQPGYYTVRAGDNIYRIGLNSSQRWQDIAGWNNLQEPYTISIGQVLRVAPLPGEAATVTPVADVAEERPAVAPEATGSRAWVWPARGRVLNRFNGSSHKGINIAGKRGDAVMAARAGVVVYAGDGLPGYGKLIIVKHDETYLTAYAHNDKLLVKEKQRVAQGQQIAEMGKTHASRVMLHFEVRKGGKPVNPMDYLKQK